MTGPVSSAVVAWWISLSAVSLLNIALWLRARRGLRGADREQRQQLWLSGVFVFVCAFRSFLPRADVQRICLVDSWFSTVLVGRTVATVAELCFMAQVAAALRGAARHLGSRPAVIASHAIVPIIAVAETCSWYAVLTTNFIGNALEESLWTLTSVLVAIHFAILARRAVGPLRRFAWTAVVLASCHVVFMSLVDVPMYVTRFLADQRAGRAYLSASESLRDLATRWVVTFRWSDWHQELAWMGLYFSAAVWGSLALVQAPRLWSRELGRVAG